MAQKATPKIARGRKNAGHFGQGLRNLEKKLLRVQTSEHTNIRFNPNPKKLFSFNFRF